MQLELFEPPPNHPPSQANHPELPPEAVQTAIGILARVIAQTLRPASPSAAEDEHHER